MAGNASRLPFVWALVAVDSIPFDSGRWTWSGAQPIATRHLERDCFLVEDGTVVDLETQDGTTELELAVGPERAFPGVVWRWQDDESYESFFVRPHQVGNPDSIQYTPVFNDVSAWQLYHGEGYGGSISFPIGEWFRIRVVFAGTRADVYVSDMHEPALQVRELKRPVEPGRVGIAVGGAAIHVASFGYGADANLRPEPPPLPVVENAIPSWDVSDPFPESDPDLSAPRTWTRLDVEPSGLANLARVHGIRDGRNSVLARAVIHSDGARAARMDFGFSDRAVVHLNGRPLFRGDDQYRSRDYRFLGSIGWWDTLYLPLQAGDNELAVAVSEDFGGWGLQARFPDASGLSFG